MKTLESYMKDGKLTKEGQDYVRQSLESGIKDLRNMLGTGNSKMAKQLIEKLNNFDVSKLNSIGDLQIQQAMNIRMQVLLNQNIEITTPSGKMRITDYIQRTADTMAKNGNYSKFAQEFMNIKNQQGKNDGYTLDYILKNFITSELTWVEGVNYNNVNGKIMLLHGGKNMDLMPDAGLKQWIEAKQFGWNSGKISRFAPKESSSAMVLEAIADSRGIVGLTGTYSLAARNAIRTTLGGKEIESMTIKQTTRCLLFGLSCNHELSRTRLRHPL